MESVADEMWHVRAEHGQTGSAQKYEFAACNNRLSLVFDSSKGTRYSCSIHRVESQAGMAVPTPPPETCQEMRAQANDVVVPSLPLLRCEGRAVQLRPG